MTTASRVAGSSGGRQPRERSLTEIEEHARAAEPHEVRSTGRAGSIGVCGPRTDHVEVHRGAQVPPVLVGDQPACGRRAAWSGARSGRSWLAPPVPARAGPWHVGRSATGSRSSGAALSRARRRSAPRSRRACRLLGSDAGLRVVGRGREAGLGPVRTSRHSMSSASLGRPWLPCWLRAIEVVEDLRARRQRVLDRVPGGQRHAVDHQRSRTTTWRVTVTSMAALAVGSPALPRAASTTMTE